jgi:hypothetical protein
MHGATNYLRKDGKGSQLTRRLMSMAADIVRGYATGPKTHISHSVAAARLALPAARSVTPSRIDVTAEQGLRKKINPIQSEILFRFHEAITTNVPLGCPIRFLFL